MENEKKENIINFDFQGWPEYKMSIKDILERVGAKLNTETNMWEIPNTEKLEVFPTVVVDDGMGYGVNEKYIIDVDCKGEVDYCNVWVDTKLENVDLFVEYNLNPGAFFTDNGKEYNISNIYKDEDGEIYVECMEWLYDGSEDFKGPMVGPSQKVNIMHVMKCLGRIEDAE